MRHLWVMDVLADLRRFAAEQRLDHLEEALAAAAQVAALELSNPPSEETVQKRVAKGGN